jgi:hypothetical protein
MHQQQGRKTGQAGKQEGDKNCPQSPAAAHQQEGDEVDALQEKRGFARVLIHAAPHPYGEDDAEIQGGGKRKGRG